MLQDDNYLYFTLLSILLMWDSGHVKQIQFSFVHRRADFIIHVMVEPLCLWQCLIYSSVFDCTAESSSATEGMGDTANKSTRSRDRTG